MIDSRQCREAWRWQRCVACFARESARDIAPRAGRGEHRCGNGSADAGAAARQPHAGDRRAAGRLARGVRPDVRAAASVFPTTIAATSLAWSPRGRCAWMGPKTSESAVVTEGAVLSRRDEPRVRSRRVKREAIRGEMAIQRRGHRCRVGGAEIFGTARQENVVATGDQASPDRRAAHRRHLDRNPHPARPAAPSAYRAAGPRRRATRRRIRTGTAIGVPA